MHPRFQPLRWFLSSIATLTLSLGVAHAQLPPSDDGSEPGTNEDPFADTGSTEEPDASTDNAVDSGAAEAVAAVSVAGGAGYKKGFFINSDDGKFALNTQARIQGRYTFESDDNGVDRDTDSNFRVARARLTLGGHAFADNIKYKFQTDFGKGGVNLKDFYLDYGFTDTFILRVGQYKRPFSRQQITSSGKLELVDRALTDGAFAGARDIGVMVHNNYEKSPDIEWAVGLFNAQRADATAIDVQVDPITGDVSLDIGNNYPTLFGPALVVRGGYNMGEDANGKPLAGYSEADLEGGPLRLGVAGSVLVDLDADDQDNRNILGEIDFVMKNNGMSATGGFYLHQQENVDGLAQFGFHLQGGYILMDKHQASARFSMISAADVVGGGDRLNSLEATVGHSLYSFSHGFKWQTDVGILGRGGADFGDEILARTQIQLSF